MLSMLYVAWQGMSIVFDILLLGFKALKSLVYSTTQEQIYFSE